MVIAAPAMFAALFSLAGSAGAYTTAPGYAAKDYATGFPFVARSGFGPIGITFDRSDNLYVSDAADDHVYRFQPGGGLAGIATRLTALPVAGKVAGLAFARDGRLYAARNVAGDVVELDQGTGAVIRTVASGIRCATGIAADPVSGDLFVSQNTCSGTIMRISGFSTGRGK